MTINDRIKEVRKALKLSQTLFGEKLGVGRGVITNIEMNLTDPKDLFVELLCNTFSVNREWLETGNGEMFKASTESIVDKLVKEYSLDDIDTSIIETYLNFNEAERSVVKKFITSVAKSITIKPSRDDSIESDIAATEKMLESTSVKIDTK